VRTRQRKARRRAFGKEKRAGAHIAGQRAGAHTVKESAQTHAPDSLIADEQVAGAGLLETRGMQAQGLVRDDQHLQHSVDVCARVWVCKCIYMRACTHERTHTHMHVCNRAHMTHLRVEQQEPFGGRTP